MAENPCSTTGYNNAWLGQSNDVLELEDGAYSQLTIDGRFWAAFDPWIRRTIAEDGSTSFVRFVVLPFPGQPFPGQPAAWRGNYQLRFQYISWFLYKIKQNYKFLYYFLLQIKFTAVHFAVNVNYGEARLCMSGAEQRFKREGPTFHPLCDSLGMSATYKSAEKDHLLNW